MNGLHRMSRQFLLYPRHQISRYWKMSTFVIRQPQHLHMKRTSLDVDFLAVEIQKTLTISLFRRVSYVVYRLGVSYFVTSSFATLRSIHLVYLATVYLEVLLSSVQASRGHHEQSWIRAYSLLFGTRILLNSSCNQDQVYSNFHCWIL